METVGIVSLLRDERDNLLAKLADPAACNAALAEAGIVAMDEMINARAKYAGEASLEGAVLSKMARDRQEVADALRELAQERETVEKAKEIASAQAQRYEREAHVKRCSEMLGDANEKVKRARAAVMDVFQIHGISLEFSEACTRNLVIAENGRDDLRKQLEDARVALEALDIGDGSGQAANQTEKEASSSTKPCPETDNISGKTVVNSCSVAATCGTAD